MADNFQENQATPNKQIDESLDDHSAIIAPDFVTNMVLAPRPSLRERVYPGRASSPLCFPPASMEFEFEFEPKVVGRLPGFSNKNSEPTHIFLRKFEEVTLLTEIRHVPLDFVRFRYISLMFKDDAERWLYSLPPNSIKTWVEFAEALLTKYVPGLDLRKLKREIYDFKQMEKEPFWKCFERFCSLLNHCPQHGIPEEILYETIYNSLNVSTKKDLEVVCQGSFFDKFEDEAWQCLEEFAETSRQWETIKEKYVEIKASSGMSENEKLDAEIFRLKQRIQELEKSIDSKSAPHIPQPNQPQYFPYPPPPPQMSPLPVPHVHQGYQVSHPNMLYPDSATYQTHVHQMQYPQAYPVPAYFQLVCNNCHSRIIMSQIAVPDGVLPVQHQYQDPYFHPAPFYLNQYSTPSNSLSIEQRMEELEMSLSKLLAKEEKGIDFDQWKANLMISKLEAENVEAESSSNQFRSEFCQHQIRGDQVRVSTNPSQEILHAKESDRAKVVYKGPRAPI